MKKINLSLIALFFSSLLMGCGMKGPLYQETSPALEQQAVENQKTTDIHNTEQSSL